MPWLSLLLVFQQALWIDVPYVQQDKNGCGSASIWMVMEFWKPGATRPVEEIQAELYSKEAGGIFARDMQKYFQARGYRVFTFRGEWDDLEQHVAKGRPLIVSLEANARGVPLHYVVVAGIDSIQNLVLMNDPAQRKLLSISRVEFERNWKASENWTLLAVPEVELASTAFREEKLPEAKEHLNSALRVNPADAYTNEFLATVYYLQNNIESALKHWNRVGKPKIEDIRTDPPLGADPVLVDRAFTFSRGTVLTLDQFRTTQARLEATGLFSRHHLELSPVEGDRFTVTLRAAERNGPHLLSWISGLPYETVQPGFFSLGGKAIHLKSTLRWDSNKRRAHVSVSAPLKGDPKWGFRVGVDVRGENWADAAGTFHMRKGEGTFEIHSTPSGRWNWTSGIAVSHRQFSNVPSRGLGLKYVASLNRTLIRDSDRRFYLDSSFALQAGKTFPANTERFLKVDNSLSMTWHGVSARWRAGRILGSPPFDELYLVGLDRDSDLWVRAHSATTSSGLKNSSFARRSFIVTNVDFQKLVHDAGFFRLSAGPFLDAARGPMSSGWIVDAGLELRATVLGNLTLKLSYGRGIRDGRNAVFLSVPQ